MSQWVVKGAVDFDIGANPSAEGGDGEEAVDDQAVKIVDIVDTFRLQVCYTALMLLLLLCGNGQIGLLCCRALTYLFTGATCLQ